jgi:hypothetical protein
MRGRAILNGDRKQQSSESGDMTDPTPIDVGMQSDGTDSAGISRVYTFANELLDFVNEAAMELIVDIPSRKFVTSGQAVYDCEQTSVTVTSLTMGLPGAEQAGMLTPSVTCMPVWSVNLEAAIVRCGPGVQRNGTVSVDDLDSAFKTSSSDAAVLLVAADKLAAVHLFGNIIASITFAPSEGGMNATTMAITAALP